jgi:hypothetical protein
MLEAIRAEDRDYRCGVSRLGEESARLLAVSRVGAGEAVVFYRAHILEKVLLRCHRRRLTRLDRRESFC